ncbi:hypothetical protein K402DRAFT_456815 [Aulographum hederae CBS 113979]|uniref:Large ribosomal subunit protein mL67 n=1 Tax=Aulographum hederae CBS 113979 TaxID=1176131 RepID=A0A6G1GQJ3_9PEZI|nr:hypothetical protein K402DRAFT_456815 [Aulographum hederae CBS 113979]
MRKAALEAFLAERHGRFIFAYNNIHTNQVVYSLTRNLNNYRALDQITFVGKKSKPSKLRKDLWKPLLTVTFPTPYQGLIAFRQLQEYRRMHEFCWRTQRTLSSFDDQKNPRSARTKWLMDQKANSVADLAAVLLGFEKKERDRLSMVKYADGIDEAAEHKQKIKDAKAAIAAREAEKARKRKEARLARIAEMKSRKKKWPWSKQAEAEDEGRAEEEAVEVEEEEIEIPPEKEFVQEPGLKMRRAAKLLAKQKAAELTAEFKALKREHWGAKAERKKEIEKEKERVQAELDKLKSLWKEDKKVSVTLLPPARLEAFRDIWGELYKQIEPTMQIENVVMIEWANAEDIDLAPAWPQVNHTVMYGTAAEKKIARHTAPHPVALLQESAEANEEVAESEVEEDEQTGLTAQDDGKTTKESESNEGFLSGPFARVRGLFLSGGSNAGDRPQV